MSNWDLERIRGLILEAGRIALSYFDYPRKEFKPDDSIVTIADRSVEAFLVSELEKPERGHYVLGEETIDSKDERYLDEAFRSTAWVIDPIDGTAPYSNNLPNWGVSIGLMESGVLQEGIVFLAALGELYYTNSGRVFREKLGTDPQVWTTIRSTAIELKRPEHQVIPEGSMITISQQLARYGCYRLPFYVQVTGSAVFNMARLAAGSYAAMVSKFKIWDFAGAWPLLSLLGWTIEYHGGGAMSNVMDARTIYRDRGNPQRWSTHDHVIFAPSPEAAEYVRKHTSFNGACSDDGE